MYSHLKIKEILAYNNVGMSFLKTDDKIKHYNVTN